MPEINKIIYAKHRKNGGHHCAYVLLNLNHDKEFCVVWFNHPSWGEQVVPDCWIQGTGLIVHQGD
eukprot:10783419-Ditylum_brightwellii.AAC.1